MAKIKKQTTNEIPEGGFTPFMINLHEPIFVISDELSNYKSNWPADYVPAKKATKKAAKKSKIDPKEEKIYSQQELDNAIAYYKNAREKTFREFAAVIAAIGGELTVPVDAVEGKYLDVKSHNSWYDGYGNKIYSTKTDGKKMPTVEAAVSVKNSNSNSVSQKVLRLIKKSSHQ